MKFFFFTSNFYKDRCTPINTSSVRQTLQSDVACCFDSLEELNRLDLSRLLAVEVNHEGGESGTGVHEALFADGCGQVHVLLAGLLTFGEARVNIGLGELKALLRPGSEVLILQLSLVDGVLGGKVGHDVGVVGPLLVAERWSVLASPLEDDGVPDAMEGIDAADLVEVLSVATKVTLGVLRVDESGGVLRLVHVTNVVDEQAKHKGALVGLSREAVDNL